MSNFTRTLKNNKQMKTATRKNTKNKRKMVDKLFNNRNKNNNLLDYSEGFIRRMTEPLTFTALHPTPEQLKQLDKLFGPTLTDDEEFELFIASQR